jgi:hypothetical protein
LKLTTPQIRDRPGKGLFVNAQMDAASQRTMPLLEKFMSQFQSLSNDHGEIDAGSLMNTDLGVNSINKTIHHFSDLFAQLGLRDDPASIAEFLTKHSAMATGMRLPDAPYWTPAQAQFLRESLLQDSDWAGLVDQLAKALQSETRENFRW